MEILPRVFYARNSDLVAQELLGKILVRITGDGRMLGKIVETEAYFGYGDPASHASRGKTPRTAIMFGPPGYAYVYFNYGFHWLFNVVTEPENQAGAVLIRAVEPLEGIELMLKNRPVKEIKELTNGPGKLTQAFRIGKEENGYDLTDSKLVLASSFCDFEIVTTPRVGISSGKEGFYRYYIKGNKFVSKKYSLSQNSFKAIIKGLVL